MIEKLKNFWKWNGLIITTRKQLFSVLMSAGAVHYKLNKKFTWESVRPIISSLEELEKNTWDKERVQFIRDWLRLNFEVKDDEN